MVTRVVRVVLTKIDATRFTGLFFCRLDAASRCKPAVRHGEPTEVKVYVELLFDPVVGFAIL